MADFTLSLSHLVAACLVFGLLVGSFLNVVIYRLPIMLERHWQRDCCELLGQTAPQHDSAFNLVIPNSTCPHCGHKIRPWENIPVVSYLFLRGACANCKNKISFRYPVIELATGLLSAYLALQVTVGWPLVFALLFTWMLIALTVIDIDHQLLPDNLTLPLLWLGLLVNTTGTFAPLSDAVIGAAAGYLTLWSVFWLFKLLTGKEGMGYGDFKLLAALGAWLGWQALPLIIILSSLVGAVIGIIGVLIVGRDKNIPIPFGPYLAVAGWIAFLWGDTITTRYLQFAGLG